MCQCRSLQPSMETVHLFHKSEFKADTNKISLNFSCECSSLFFLRDYLSGLATQYDEIIDVRTPLEFEEVSTANLKSNIFKIIILTTMTMKQTYIHFHNISILTSWEWDIDILWQDHIVGAVNLPVLTNDQRAQVAIF